MKLISQVLLAVAVVAAFAGGLFLLVRSSTSGERMEILLPTATPASEVELKVYLSGAIRNPGVYSVQEGERLSDAVAAAGGPTEDADMAAVNLAQRVKDEQHWHIPKKGEEVRDTAGQGQPPSSSAMGRLDLNATSVEELKALPGIGDVRAESIVRYREGNGPFSRVDDIVAVRGIGQATLDAIRDLVEVK